MRRVGEVVQSAQGLAVVRSTGEDVPEVGATLVDESLTAVGEVVAVFGPVERPYIAASPRVDSVAGVVGRPVYTR